MIKFIEYFSKRHLLTNLIMMGIFIGGVFFWNKTGKEEFPDITLDIMRVSVSYPGASPQEVEYFVAEPIEEKLETVDGIYEARTSCSQGACSIIIEIEKDENIDAVVSDIKSAVLDVKLPDGVRDEPRFRQFKTSNKAIIDVAIINKDRRFLDYKSRVKLQALARSLETKLTTLPSVSEVSWRGYLDREIQILLKPEALIKYNISVNEALSALRNNSVRQPAGIIKSENDAKITVLDELQDVTTIKNLIVRGGFEGQRIRLKQLADVVTAFEDQDSIMKINGYEGLYATIRKNSSSGIVKAVDKIKQAVEDFKTSNLKGTSIDVVTIDDESRDVRSRLSLISMNGAIGFTFIIITLLIFLDITSSFWVAMGIPFSFCFTMVVASLMGYTINNVTLAGVIIVMGMIVDDAIIVAENVTRFKYSGMPLHEAVVKGTAYVFQPILASIATTCIAFVPLLFFEGRFGIFISYIPAVITLMLLGSLLESIIILPGHLSMQIPVFIKNILGFKNNNRKKYHWFHTVEDAYGSMLERALRFKSVLFLIFALLIGIAVYIFKTEMKFVMFPGEESTITRLNGEAPPETKKYETAKRTIAIEDILTQYLGREVLNFRTTIARSRRGRAAKENVFDLRIEIVPRDKRNKSLKQLQNEWLAAIEEKVDGFDEIKFSKRRFGHASGSPIEIMVRENNEDTRESTVNSILASMKEQKDLKNAEIEKFFRDKEYMIGLKRDVLNKLDINPSSVGTAFRAAAEGITVFEFREDDEEYYVKLSMHPEAKQNMDKIINMPIENKSGYLVPLKDVVNVKKERTPNTITRIKGKRKTSIYADLAEETQKTPVEIAEYFEQKVFPEVLSKNPSTSITFEGEVKDTRESAKDFRYAIILVLFLIFAVLAVLFNSVIKPFIIMLAIPFGCAGIILAYKLHGMLTFGFMSAVGALGLAGVVINDSIVMLVKLDREYDNPEYGNTSIERIANIAKTRVRAVLLTTLTTCAGLIPTAYGLAGYDSMLAEMMLAMAWGLIFGTLITLLLMPSIYSLLKNTGGYMRKAFSKFADKSATTPYLSNCSCSFMSLLKFLYIKVAGAAALIVLVILSCQQQCIADKTRHSLNQARQADDYSVLPGTPTHTVVTLDEFINRTCSSNPEFQEILIDEAKLAYSKALKLPANDLVLDAAGEYILVLDESDEDSEISYNVGLSKLFVRQGTEVDLSYNLSPSRVGTGMKSAFSASVLQPVLNNAFGKANKLLDKIVGMETDVARYQIVEAYEDYLAAQIVLYYEWYAAYENLKEARGAFDDSQKLLDNIKEKRKSRIARKMDVDKSYLQMLTKKETLLKARNKYNKLKYLIKDALQMGEKDDLIPAFSTLRGITEPNFASEFSEFTKTSRTFRMLELLEKHKETYVDYYADDLLPSASVKFKYTMDEDGYIFEDIIKENLFIGVYLKKSFQDLQARALHETSKIDSEKEKLSISNSKDKLHTDLQNIYEDIQTKQKLAALANEKIEAARSVANDEQLFYAQGRSTLNNLIDALNALDRYKHAYITHQVELNILIAEWLRLTDQLVKKGDRLLFSK